MNAALAIYLFVMGAVAMGLVIAWLACRLSRDLFKGL